MPELSEPRIEWDVKGFPSKGNFYAKALEWKGAWHVERKRRKVSMSGTGKARKEVAENEIRKMTT